MCTAALDGVSFGGDTAGQSRCRVASMSCPSGCCDQLSPTPVLTLIPPRRLPVGQHDGSLARVRFDQRDRNGLPSDPGERGSRDDRRHPGAPFRRYRSWVRQFRRRRRPQLKALRRKSTAAGGLVRGPEHQRRARARIGQAPATTARASRPRACMPECPSVIARTTRSKPSLR